LPASSESHLPARRLAIPYALSAIVAVLLLVSSVAGLLFGQRGLYDPATAIAFLGQDAISLVIGLPLFLGSLWLARRGSVRGLLVWLGTLFYILYAYAYFVFGVRFNALYLVYIAIVSLSIYALLWALFNVDPEAVKARFRPALPNRIIGGYLIAVGVLFVVVWFGMVISTLISGATLNPILHLVSTLDLTESLPVAFIGGILLWRRDAWGYVISALALVNTTVYMFTLAATTVWASFLGTPADPLLALYTVVFLVGLVATVLYLRAISNRA
jgi:hypothetical protein